MPGSIPSEVILGGTASHFSAQCVIWKLTHGARPNQSVSDSMRGSIPLGGGGGKFNSEFYCFSHIRPEFLAGSGLIPIIIALIGLTPSGTFGVED